MEMGHFEFFPPGEVGGRGMPRLVFRKRLRLAQLTLTGGAREMPRLAPSLPPSLRRRDVKTCQKT